MKFLKGSKVGFRIVLCLTVLGFLASVSNVYSVETSEEAKKCIEKYDTGVQKCLDKNKDKEEARKSCLDKLQPKLDKCLGKDKGAKKAFGKEVDACQGKDEKCIKKCKKDKECIEKCNKNLEACVKKLSKK